MKSNYTDIIVETRFLFCMTVHGGTVKEDEGKILWSWLLRTEGRWDADQCIASEAMQTKAPLYIQ